MTRPEFQSLLDGNGHRHGTIPAYGPVNSCGLVANLAMVMGKKAIVASGGTVDAAHSRQETITLIKPTTRT